MSWKSTGNLLEIYLVGFVDTTWRCLKWIIGYCRLIIHDFFAFKQIAYLLSTSCIYTCVVSLETDTQIVEIKKTGNNFYQKKIIEIYTTVFSSRFWTELLVICFCRSSKVSLYDILHCSLLLSRLCFCLGLSVRQQDHSVTYGWIYMKYLLSEGLAKNSRLELGKSGALTVRCVIIVMCDHHSPITLSFLSLLGSRVVNVIVSLHRFALCNWRLSAYS